MNRIKKTGLWLAAASLGLLAMPTQAQQTSDDARAVNPYVQENQPNARDQMTQENPSYGGMGGRSNIYGARDPDNIGPVQVKPRDLAPNSTSGTNVPSIHKRGRGSEQERMSLNRPDRTNEIKRNREQMGTSSSGQPAQNRLQRQSNEGSTEGSSTGAQDQATTGTSTGPNYGTNSGAAPGSTSPGAPGSASPGSEGSTGGSYPPEH